VVPRSDQTSRSVGQLLFVIDGSHTGAFIGSVIPNSRHEIPGDVFSVLLIAVIFALPFVVDANRDDIYRRYRSFVNDPLDDQE
jgi:hypothetical protein